MDERLQQALREFGHVAWYKMKRDEFGPGKIEGRTSHVGGIAAVSQIPSSSFVSFSPSEPQQHQNNNNNSHGNALHSSLSQRLLSGDFGNSQQYLLLQNQHSRSANSQNSQQQQQQQQQQPSLSRNNSNHNDAFAVPAAPAVVTGNNNNNTKWSAPSDFVAALSCRASPSAVATLLITDLKDTHFIATITAKRIRETFEELGIDFRDNEALETITRCIHHSGADDTQSKCYFGVLPEKKKKPKNIDVTNNSTVGKADDDNEENNVDEGNDDHFFLDAATDTVRARLVLETRLCFDAQNLTARAAFYLTSLPKESEASRRFVRDCVLFPVLRDTHALRAVATQLVKEKLQVVGGLSEPTVLRAAKDLALGQPAVGPEGAVLEALVRSSEIGATARLPINQGSAAHFLNRVTATMVPDPAAMKATATFSAISISSAPKVEEVALSAICSRVAEQSQQHHSATRRRRDT